MGSPSAGMATAGPPDLGPPRGRRSGRRLAAIVTAVLVVVLVGVLITVVRVRGGTDEPTAGTAEPGVTAMPTTAVPTAAVPTTAVPTTAVPTTAGPTTSVPGIAPVQPTAPPTAGQQQPATPTGDTSSGTTGAGWTPKPGAQWQWQLSSTPTLAELATAYAAGARAFDIDGDAATTAIVTAIHALGSDVGAVCYIDVGGWEDYRSDAANFPDSVKGSAVDGWPSEKWLDVRQIAILKPLMQARVQMCASKGFDAVEPDLLDGYANDTGFPITADQQITYNTMIAGLAHAAGLTVAQKGDVDQAAALEPVFDWTLNEQCGQYDECDSLAAYTAAGKAVWIVEYSGFPAVCATDFPVAGAAAMYKSLDLTADPRTPCLNSSG